LESIANTIDEKSEGHGTFDACAYVVDGERPPNDEAVLERISQMVKPGGVLVILLTADLDRPLQDDRRDCADLTRRLLQRGIRVEEARCVPAGPVRVTLARAMAATIRAGRASPRAALPLLLAAGALIAGAILGCNLLIRTRRPRLPPRGDCSGILLVGHSPATPAMSAIDCQSPRGYDHPEFAAPRRAVLRLAGVPEADPRAEPRLAIRRHRRTAAVFN
jgi:hypothetical protein